MKAHYHVLQRVFFCFGASVISRALSALSLPVMLYTLPPHEVGLYGICTTYISLSAVFLTLGMRQIFSPEYGKCTMLERDSFFINFLVSTSLFAVGVALLVVAGSCFFSTHFFSPSRIFLIVCTGICFYLQDIILQWCALQKWTAALVGIQLLSACVVTFGTVATVITKSFFTLIVAQCIGYALSATFVIYYVYQHQLCMLLSSSTMYRLLYEHLWSATLYIPFILRPILFVVVGRLSLAYYGNTTQLADYTKLDIIHALFQFGIMVPLNQTYLADCTLDFIADKTTFIRHKKIMWSLVLLLLIGAFLGYAFLGLTRKYIPVELVALKEWGMAAVITQIALLASAFMGTYLCVVSHPKYISGALLVSVLVQLLVQLFCSLFMQPLSAILCGLCSGSLAFFLLSFMLSEYYYRVKI